MNPELYKRPNKPFYVTNIAEQKIPPKPDFEIPEPIYVGKETECFITPKDVADRMVQYLAPMGDKMTLEPSAGTGALADALKRAGHSMSELCLVERNIALCNELYRFSPAGIINDDFLEWANKVKGKTGFSRVIMNPPFSKAKKHVEAALSLLNNDGHEQSILVALVPETFKHPEATKMETLNNHTFANTSVRSKIIQIRRS